MGVDMPLCSRRAWTTFQGPVDPSRLPTCPPQVATTTASSFHAFNPDTQAGRRRVFIMTTIQTQRPTLLYVSQFYPDKTRTTVPLLSRHSQHVDRLEQVAEAVVGKLGGISRPVCGRRRRACSFGKCRRACSVHTPF